MSQVWRPCPGNALHGVVTFLTLCLAGGGDWRWDVRVTNDAGPHLHIAIFVNTICLWNQLDPRRVCTGLSTLPTIEHRIVCCRVNITLDQDTVGWSLSDPQKGVKWWLLFLTLLLSSQSKNSERACSCSCFDCLTTHNINPDILIWQLWRCATMASNCKVQCPGHRPGSYLDILIVVVLCLRRVIRLPVWQEREL